MSEWNIGCMRRAGGFMGTMAILIVGVYAADILSPSAIAIARDMRQAPTTSAPTAAPNTQQSDYSHALLRIRHHLRILSGRTDARRRIPNRAERHASRAALRRWNGQLQGFDAQAKAQFAATGRMIKDKHLPAVIQERYAQALAKYRERFAALKSDLDGIDRAPDDASAKAKAEAALQWLSGKHLRHTQAPLDMRHLPFSRLKADPNRKPFTKKSQFIAAGLYSNPSARFASIGPFDISQMPSAQNPAYLAATTEVTLTPDVVAEASALSGNPVAIYSWVRNNVQWQPTWGAIQTASQTLSSRRGNAFDIASLMIALLRASGIPARYVVGTIDVPATQFENWAGGFKNIDAAIQFASSGGIPITGLTTAGGQITSVQMEHVWVEAAVDFVPSRGAVNKAANTWVAMDPSFKQIQMISGLNLPSVSGVDPVQIGNNFVASGTVDPSYQWASGFNQSILQTAETQELSTVQNYLTTNLPNATMGQVFGGRSIVIQAASVLPAALPYEVAVVGARYATLPTALEQSITFAFGQDVDGSPLNPQTFPWASLNNQEVTLSFAPATQADQAALAALLPSGAITNFSQLPTSIPAYLINVVPQLKVNGTVVMTGSPMTLGADLTFVFNPTFVTAGVKPFSYTLPAGAYLAIAVVGGSVAPEYIDAVQAQIQATSTALQTGSTPPNRQRLIGDLFYAGVLDYYEQYTTQAYLNGLPQGGHYNLAAGLGSFGYEPKVSYLLGIPRTLEPGGVATNIPIVNVIGVDSTNQIDTRNFTIQLGVLSSVLENAVPEQLFDQPGQFVDGVSAVKALVRASAAGQRIFAITAANEAAVLPLIHHDSATMDDISAALSAGETVITSTDSVSLPGWTGCGYVILDPVTGDGAWKIAGGANGGGLYLGTVLFFFGAILFAIFIEQNPLAALTIFGSFLIFANTVKAIGKSNDTPAEAEAALERASSVAALEIIAAFGLSGLAEAADDARISLLEYYMTATVWTYDLAFD
jgi:hypothetical protein